MALGMNSNSKARHSSFNTSTIGALDKGSELVNCTRTLRRKRVTVSNHMESFPFGSPFKTPLKKRYGAKLGSKNSSIEALPQDILVRILCGVDHEDLKQLFHVSKSIREATLIAKGWHFEFSTPNSKTAAIRSFSESEDLNKFDMETPNAPTRKGFNRPRISREKLSDISVALFHSPEEEKWPKKNNGMFMETEI
ncbi:F-box domain [Macleaya cordata]|uniref:F-box domain n=1 Tax=Macleaya cordata TaxID=56857 RepID=A0A200QVF4_MACCD|nr:F-box domain [Macleaya cordata]